VTTGGRVAEVLAQARTLGFLGPGPVEAHIDHADGFVEVVESALGSPATVLDLGSGGGVPGLVLVARWPSADVVLLEARARRADFLRSVIGDLGWSSRVTVLSERGEAAAHDQKWRERFAVVTARSFASPPVTAEIAAGFVAPGGVAVVSEPPDAQGLTERWPAEPIAHLGFGSPVLHSTPGGHFVSLPKRAAAPANRPRRVGQPAKRPLW
jgi:16S rRNA (guanine527-N7)-methyltransferase